MSIDINGVLDELTSHAARLGRFEKVNGFEPKNNPGNGLSAAIWVNRIDPIKNSPLNATSIRLEFQFRIYQNFISEPQDAIDPNVFSALDLLMDAYSNDFTLNTEAREIDLLGQFGTGLSAQAGYIDMAGKLYRQVTLTIPVIIDDVWTQAG
jgi:hypothetical protein